MRFCAGNCRKAACAPTSDEKEGPVLLQEVSIRNFALIDEARLRLSPGLNVLTGETGAGKSILIDAVELALGGRASAEAVRTGADRAVVDVVFDLSSAPAARGVLDELGLGEPGDPTLVICREVPVDGRTTCRVNGRAVSLTALRQVTQPLIDIHGQHEHQSLLRLDRHIDLVDAFGGEDAAALRRETAQAHRSWQKVLADIRSLGGDERERAHRLDLLRFQVEEIDRAELRDGEEEDLQVERRLLANAEKRRDAAAMAYASLHSSDVAGRGSARDQIGRALVALEELASLDPSLSGTLETVRQTSYQVEDAGHELRRYRDEVMSDPMRLAEVERRLDLIGELKRKYGRTVAEVRAFGENSRSELLRLENSAELLAKLEQEALERRDQLDVASGKLSEVRNRVAGDLERAVETSLTDLGMKKVCFRVELNPEDPPGPRGGERAEFLFSPNPGEPPKPLARIASGGEMSRVMLALKAILATVDEIPTMIFDEVDTGVGGGAAQAVGEKLAAIALNRQVICVTHLARIASLADAHHFIAKEIQDGRTRTHVQTLGHGQRVEEVARMLAGQPPTAITMAHAREMLEQGSRTKEDLRRAPSEVASGSDSLFPPRE